MISLDLDAMVAAAHRLLAAHGLTVDGAGDNDRIISPAITSARDVLALADALRAAEARAVAAEAERDEARMNLATALAPNAADAALDDIAHACGCAQWEYPAQVARDVLAVVAARDAAVTGHAALAGAVRAYLDADRDWRRSRYMIAEHINAAAVENTERLSVERYAAWAALDALLRGAPCGYVPVGVVREYLTAVDASRRIAGEADDILSEAAVDDWRNRYDEANAAKRAARTALDAALAAATTTPKESP